MKANTSMDSPTAETEKMRAWLRSRLAALNWFFVFIIGFTLASPLLARAFVTAMGGHPAPLHKIVPRDAIALFIVGGYQAVKSWRQRRR